MAVEENLRSKRLYKLMLGVMKIIPMLLALCDVLNMVTDYFGIELSIFSILGGVSVLPLLFFYLVSFVFRYCIYHRLFLHYILVNNLLVYYDYYIGIPVEDRTMFLIHMIVAGLFLFLVLYFYRKEKCCRL